MTIGFTDNFVAEEQANKQKTTIDGFIMNRLGGSVLCDALRAVRIIHLLS